MEDKFIIEINSSHSRKSSFFNTIISSIFCFLIFCLLQQKIEIIYVLFYFIILSFCLLIYIFSSNPIKAILANEEFLKIVYRKNYTIFNLNDIRVTYEKYFGTTKSTGSHILIVRDKKNKQIIIEIHPFISGISDCQLDSLSKFINKNEC